MALFPSSGIRERFAALKRHSLDAQHRNAFLLVLGNVIGAGTGLLFWLLLTRVAQLPSSAIGVGYAIVGMGATIGVVAKGGLDTALLRSVPGETRPGAIRLLRFAMFVGGAAAVVLTFCLGVGARLFHALPQITSAAWILVGGIAVLLHITWLQDAYFLAEGNARFGVQRNLVLSVTRVLLPLPIIALGVYEPVATIWVVALATSLLVAVAVGRRGPARRGREVPRAQFLRQSFRNEAGSAFEFLPGLVLAPVVLMVDGASSAGLFAIVWAAASLLFVLSAAICRSALAHMVRHGPGAVPDAVRKGAWQHLIIVAPAAAAGLLVQDVVLGLFGRQYAADGAMTFGILCASIVFVAPSYLYLSVLRAEDRSRPLLVFPALMLATLMILTPILEAALGLPGVGLAWLLTNAPFGIFAAWKLHDHVREVIPHRSLNAAVAPPLLD